MSQSQTPNTAIAVIGIDIGKNSFHVVGHDARGGLILAPCSAQSRRGLATPEPAVSQAPRPALTAPVRDATHVLRAGTKERLLARTKELRDRRSKR
jgi:hypothetical protein